MISKTNCSACTNINVRVRPPMVPQWHASWCHANTECNLEGSLSEKFSLHAKLPMHLMMISSFVLTSPTLQRNSVWTRCGANDATISIVTFPFTWSPLWFHWGKASLCHQIFLEFTGLANPERFFCAKVLEKRDKKRTMKRGIHASNYSTISRSISNYPCFKWKHALQRL